MNLLKLAFNVSLGLSLSLSLGCQKQEAEVNSSNPAQGLRPLTTAEATSDFRLLANHFKAFYGPLEYKEKRFQFSFDQWASEIEAQIASAKSDAEVFGLYSKFLARLQDGHVGIRFQTNSTGIQEYNIPIFVIPMENTFVVENVEGLTGTKIARGDELLSIDGKPMAEILQVILKYEAMATPESNKHYIYKAFSRSFYLTELTPVSNIAKVVFRKPDGTTLTEEFVWKLIPVSKEKFVENQKLAFELPNLKEMQKVSGASIMGMSKPTPFFATAEVTKDFQFQTVTADEIHRKKFALAETEKPDIFAAIYKYQGKNLLLVRNYIYSHGDATNVAYLKAYKAILNQWEPFVDALVLDQTHNGGGTYCEEFFRLFIKDQKNAFVQSQNVDRKWILDFITWGGFIGNATGSDTPQAVFHAMSASMEKSYDAGATMSPFMPIIGGKNKVTPADYTWKKPMLVLIDELAGSCGDAFPMLIKNNNVAKLFGAKTMGLGGNVEGFTLPHSQTNFRLTRGLFTSYRDDETYTPEMMIENNGVTPDYPYEHTLKDFRAGFIGYVEAFSKKALEQIPPSK